MPLKLHFDQEISLLETSTIQCLQSQIPLNRILLAFYFACSNFFHIEILDHDAFKGELLVQIWVHLHLINWLCVFFKYTICSLSYWFARIYVYIRIYSLMSGENGCCIRMWTALNLIFKSCERLSDYGKTVALMNLSHWLQMRTN